MYCRNVAKLFKSTPLGGKMTQTGKLAGTKLTRFLSDLLGQAKSRVDSLLQQRNSPKYDSDVAELARKMDEMTPESLPFPLPTADTWSGEQAPCLYSEFYRDPEVTLCAFTLRKAGNRLPLHDHPYMHGFLKVVSGSVEVRAYSWLTQEEENAAFLPDKVHSKLRTRFAAVRPAKFEQRKVISSSDPCCQLSPQVGNIHEVKALEDCSTFVDLLMPSYSPPDVDCHYYVDLDEVVDVENADGSEANIDQNWLEMIACPEDYWTAYWPPRERTNLLDQGRGPHTTDQ